MAELQEIINRYKLQDTRILVDRNLIYPTRPNDPPPEEAIAKLESALLGDEISGTVRIHEGGENLYYVCDDKVLTPMAPRLAEISNQERADRDPGMAPATTIQDDTLPDLERLETFTEAVSDPMLKQWGYGTQILHHKAMQSSWGYAIGHSIGFSVGYALGRAYYKSQLPTPSRLDQAVRELVRLFGKDGQYEGDRFRYESSDQGVKVSFKDGTVAYQNGEYNLKVPLGKLVALKNVPKEVDNVKRQVQSLQRAKHRDRSESKTADLAM